MPCLGPISGPLPKPALYMHLGKHPSYYWLACPPIICQQISINADNWPIDKFCRGRQLYKHNLLVHQHIHLNSDNWMHHRQLDMLEIPNMIDDHPLENNNFAIMELLWILLSVREKPKHIAKALLLCSCKWPIKPIQRRRRRRRRRRKGKQLKRPEATWLYRLLLI